MRASCCRALLALGLIVLTGCATGGDGLPRRTGLLIEPAEARPLGYVLNWSQDLDVPGGDHLVDAKVLGDMLVTVENPSNLVTAVSLRDGRILWRRVIGDATKRLYAPARIGNHILVNTDARLYLLNHRTGEVEGLQNLGRLVAMGPAVLDELAVFGSVDGTVFAHNVSAQFSAWEYQLTHQIITPPVVSGNHVFAADGRGVYVLLNAEGEASWRGRTFGPISAAPAIDQAAVYVASEDRALYALTRNHGQDRWPAPFRTAGPITLGPKSFDLVVLQPLPDQGTVALDSIDGSVRWRLDETALPITRAGEDAILATPHSLLRVELDSGDVIARGETLRLSHVLEGPDDSLILVSPRGRVLRMNPSR